jgi:antirestriction protein
VWIGCLAAYNAGKLHGEWVDAIDVDELFAGTARVLKSSPEPLAEEWFVADYDGFGDLPSRLGEWPDFVLLAEIGAAIEEHGDAVIAYVGYCEGDLANFEEAYQGEWESEKHYAYEWADEIGLFKAPPCRVCGHREDDDGDSIAERYFDWDSYTRDLFNQFTSVDVGQGRGVYVFGSVG